MATLLGGHLSDRLLRLLLHLLGPYNLKPPVRPHATNFPNVPKLPNLDLLHLLLHHHRFRHVDGKRRSGHAHAHSERKNAKT